MIGGADTALAAQLAGIDAGGSEDDAQQRADELLARIAWSRLAEPGDRVAGVLLAAIGAPAALDLLAQGANTGKLHATITEAGGELSTRAASEALGRWMPRLNRAETVADICRATSSSLRLLLPGDPLWPAALDDLGPHSPLLLWLRGDPSVLTLPALSVVGARAASGYGSHVTAEIVDGVCAAGLAIVSGAAYGIDAVAHRTALAAGAPSVAVLAGGVDRPYPSAHTELLDRVADTGAVCGEMVPGSAPTKWRFLQRNRVIAALSGATLVAEAGMRSGSLNTAGHAAELGRALGAVPGPVTSASSAGCHRLIRDYDAVLVTNAREACELAGVTDELAVVHDRGAEEGAWERRILDAFPLRGSRDAADLAKRAGLTLAQTRGVLVELELLGHVRRAEEDPEQRDAPESWTLLRPQK